MLLAFRWLRALTGERAALLAVLATSIFLSDRRETSFSYNTSSSLLFVAAALCTARGINGPRPAWLFAAGTWIGILPFARIPNLLAVALLAGPVLAALLDSDRRARLLPDFRPPLQCLTKTRPYLNRPWSMSYESPEVIAQLAADAPKRTGCLPVVVAH
jgi:hypothetical protein